MDENSIKNIENEAVEEVNEAVEPKFIQKNMATCTSLEFLVQANKIRHYVESWLKETKILEIRKNHAKQIPITADMSPEELKAVKAANEEARAKQVRKNLSDMLDACLETHAEQTLKVLAMLCFVNPSQANEIPVSELLDNFGQMIADDGVMRFFGSFMKWEGMLSLT